MSILPVLSARAEDSSDSVDIDVPVAHAVDAQIAILQDPDSPTDAKSQVCGRLLRLEGRAWPATDALLDLVQDPRIHPSAEQVLRSIGPVAAQHLGWRIASLHPNLENYVLILASIPRGRNAAVPPLCEAITDGSVRQRVVALRTLARLGDVSSSAWPEIRASLEARVPQVRDAALPAAEAALNLNHTVIELALRLSKDEKTTPPSSRA